MIILIIKSKELKEKTRELVEILLSGNTQKLTKVHFFSFSIAKFVLIKEKILIKTGQRKFYFGKKQKAKYMPMIMKFKEEIIKNASYVVNNIEIESEEKLTPEEKEALWFFNKVRDSLVHNKYNIDLDSNTINIDNVNDTYSLKCSIPIELFNSITFYIEKSINSNDDFSDYKDYLNSYDNYMNEMASLYNFDKVYDNKIYNNKIYNDKIYNNKIDDKIYDDKIHNNKIYNNKIHNNKIYNNKIYNNKIYNDKIHNNKIDDKIYDDKNIYNILYVKNGKEILEELQNNELNILFNKLLNSPKVSNEKLSDIVGLLKDIQQKSKNSPKTEIEIDEIDKMTSELIKEISRILGVRNNDAAIGLYNYMCITLSEIEDRQDDYAYMGLNPNPRFMQFLNGRDINYNSKISKIKKVCCSFNEKVEPLIKSYKEHPNNAFKRSLATTFTKFYSEIISLLRQKNEIIVSSFRNYVEHANYSLIENNSVFLYDMTNPNDLQSIKFAYENSVRNVFSLMTKIDDNNRNNYTFIKFAFDLSSIVQDKGEEYKILNNLMELSKIILGTGINIDDNVEEIYNKLISKI